MKEHGESSNPASVLGGLVVVSAFTLWLPDRLPSQAAGLVTPAVAPANPVYDLDVTQIAPPGGSPATPDTTCPLDNDWPAIAWACDLAAALDDGPVTIRFPPGRYDLQPEDRGALTSALRLRNRLGNESSTVDNDFPLRLIGLGAGAELVVRDRPDCHLILVEGRDLVEVANLEFRHDPLPFTQGTVVSVSSSGTACRVQLDPHPSIPDLDSRGFRAAAEKNGGFLSKLAFLVRTNNDYSYKPDFRNRRLRYQLGGPAQNLFRSGPPSAKTWDIQGLVPTPNPVAVGDTFVVTMRQAPIDFAAIGLGPRTDDFSIHDCVFHSGGLVLANAEGSGGFTMERVDFVPAFQDAALAAHGDMLVWGGRDPFTIVDCNIRCFDDTLNLRSRSETVLSAETDGTDVVAVFEETPSFDVEAGDTLQFLRRTGTRAFLCTLPVLAVEGEEIMYVRLDNTAGEPVPVTGDLMFNLALSSPGSLVERCEFRLGAGFHFRSFGGVARDLTFVNCKGGIELELGFLQSPQPLGPAAQSVSMERIALMNCGLIGSGYNSEAGFFAQYAQQCSFRDIVMSGGFQVPMLMQWVDGMQFANVVVSRQGATWPTSVPLVEIEADTTTTVDFTNCNLTGYSACPPGTSPPFSCRYLETGPGTFLVRKTGCNF